jgi:hypothetical protein
MFDTLKFTGQIDPVVLNELMYNNDLDVASKQKLLRIAKSVNRDGSHPVKYTRNYLGQLKPSGPSIQQLETCFRKTIVLGSRDYDMKTAGLRLRTQLLECSRVCVLCVCVCVCVCVPSLSCLSLVSALSVLS